DSFLVNIDEEGISCSSAFSTPTYPPGFEPIQEGMNDFSCSRYNIGDESQPIIPRKLKSEYKRLGIAIETVCTPTFKSRRSTKTSGPYLSK
ncbi:hypothetical protein MKX01_005963, partial [Papaver californicum]